MQAIHLGVNIDHVATLRQVRRAAYPDPLFAALLAASVLALGDAKLAKRLEVWRKKQSDAVAETPEDKA